MRKKCLPVAILCAFMPMLLGGCDNSSIYSSVDSDIISERLMDSSMGSTKYFSAERYLEFCEKMKVASIPIIIISIIIGIVIYRVFRNDKPIQKKAIGLLIIGIPFVTLLLVYGSCYLYGKFF